MLFAFSWQSELRVLNQRARPTDCSRTGSNRRTRSFAARLAPVGQVGDRSREQAGLGLVGRGRATGGIQPGGEIGQRGLPLGEPERRSAVSRVVRAAVIASEARPLDRES